MLAHLELAGTGAGANHIAAAGGRVTLNKALGEGLSLGVDKGFADGLNGLQNRQFAGFVLVIREYNTKTPITWVVLT